MRNMKCEMRNDNLPNSSLAVCECLMIQYLGKGNLCFQFSMVRPRKKDYAARHGEKPLGVFRVSLCLSAEEKAIAILTAEYQGKALSHILRNGMVCEATRSGVMANGRCVLQKSFVRG